MVLRSALMMGVLAIGGCRREPTATPPAETHAREATAKEATKAAPMPAPPRATFPRTPGRIAAGDGHSCVLAASGEAWCWGDNAWGQLGDGREVGSRVPVRVPGLTDLISVAANTWSTCALRRDGEVWCWGAEPHGTADRPRFAARRSPVRIAGLPPARAIAVGQQFVCATTASELWCWGAAPRGVAARNGDPPTATPVRIPDVGGSDELCAGNSFACARSGAEIRCWGPNMQHDTWLPVTPGPVEGLAPAATVTCGFETVCVAGIDGHVTCARSQFARGPAWGDDAPADASKLEDVTGVPRRPRLPSTCRASRPRGHPRIHHTYRVRPPSPPRGLPAL